MSAVSKTKASRDFKGAQFPVSFRTLRPSIDLSFGPSWGFLPGLGNNTFLWQAVSKNSSRSKMGRDQDKWEIAREASIRQRRLYSFVAK